MRDFTKFLLKAGIRYALTALGAALLAWGVITKSEADGFIATYLEEIVGSVLMAVSAAWEFVYQKYVKDKVTTALALPQHTSPETLAKVLGEKE